jgi:cytidylate kinase
MYRAVTLAVQERGLAPDDAEACSAVAEELELTFDGEGRIQVDGRPGEPAIRSAEVSRAVSIVSAHPGVRRALVRRQRALARRGIVVEGRDTTTVVFPDADHRFFLDASAAERARRRAAQLGEPEREGEIERALERRDGLDATRSVSPLVRGEGVEVVQTDGLDADAVVAELLRRVSGGVERRERGA